VTRFGALRAEPARLGLSTPFGAPGIGVPFTDSPLACPTPGAPESRAHPHHRANGPASRGTPDMEPGISDGRGDDCDNEIDLAATYGVPFHPSNVRSPAANRQLHAKMPSTQPVPAACQTSMMQRGRFWEEVLQRLSGPASGLSAKGTPMPGAPNGVDETSRAGSARRRRIGPREAKHLLPEPGTRTKEEILMLGANPRIKKANAKALPRISSKKP